MTSVLTNDNMSRYVFPATTNVPSILLNGLAELDQDVQISTAAATAVFRQDLVCDVTHVINKINMLLHSVTPLVEAEALVDSSDHTPYDAMYSSTRARATVHRDDSVPDLYDDEVDFWH